MNDTQKVDPAKLANNLFAYLKFKRDYDEQSGLRKKILIVEGKTDYAFFEPIAREDTRYICVSDFILGHMAMMSSKPPKPQSVKNKKTIIELIKHFFIQGRFGLLPSGKDLPIYGLVDNDFDTDLQYSPYTKLFFTGTHDIETLMLSTDHDVLLRIPDCTISKEEILRAFYIAAQLCLFRQAIYNAHIFDIINITDDEGIVHYASFTSGDKIDLGQLLDYLNDNSEQQLSKAKLKKCKERISHDLKKSIDKDGCWKKTFEVFSNTIDDEFWKTVTGHDVLSAIRYINPSVKRAFGNRTGYRLNRDLEFALSKSYDYTHFVSTDLYYRLIMAELILPCENAIEN